MDSLELLVDTSVLVEHLLDLFVTDHRNQTLLSVSTERGECLITC